MIKNKKNITIKVTFFLFFIFFLIGILTFKDYGISIDEEFQRSSGFYWLSYILSFTSFDELKNLVNIKIAQIEGFTLPSVAENPYYGVIFDLPAALLEVLLKIDDPQDYFHFRHFFNFIFFFTSSIFFFKLLQNRFSNYNISLIGTLFFILSPRIYGNGFFNNKDIIFLSLLTIALYYCFKSIEKLSYKNLTIFAIFTALCTAQRILGIFLPTFFIIIYLLSILSNKKRLKNFQKIIFYIF